MEVIARHALDGRVEPLTIIWADGRRFQVERILKASQGACLKTAGRAVRYDVVINHATKHIYHSNEGWFVEVLDNPDFTSGTKDPRLVGASA